MSSRYFLFQKNLLSFLNLYNMFSIEYIFKTGVPKVHENKQLNDRNTWS